MTEQSKNKIIANRYSVLQTLGEGGMGVVFLCRDTTLERDVAVKVLETGADMDAVQRFQLEAKAAAKLKHDNILQVMDFGESDGHLFLVMDYLKGMTLTDLIRQESFLEPEQAIPIFLQICDGIAHAHLKDVLHRDIKPSNIMLVDTESGWDVKIVDFGIAKITSMPDQNLTTTGSVVGSPLYISPEAGLGQKCDSRSDIYSLGCLMYETLTGKPPFKGDTAFDTIMMHKNEAPPTLSQSTGKDFDAHLEQIIAQCLEKEPQERFQTINQLRNQFLKISDERKSEALESGHNVAIPFASTRRSDRSKKALLVFGPITLAGLSLVGITCWNSFKVDSSPSVSLSPSLPVSNTPHLLPMEIEPTDPLDLTDPLKNEKGESVKAKPSLTDAQLSMHASKYKDVPLWRMQDTRIKGPGLKSLLNFPIKGLDLKNTSIDADALKTISNMKQLAHLDITGCINVKPEDLKALEKLRNLETIQITLPYDKVDSMKMIDGLKELRQIRTVTIAGTVTVEMIEKLKQMKRLNQLTIAVSSKELDSKALGRALGDLPQLTMLFMKNDTLDAISLKELARRQTEIGRKEKLTQLQIVLPGSREESLRIVGALTEFTDLQTLTIDGAISSKLLKPLFMLPKLKSVKIPEATQPRDRYTQGTLTQLGDGRQIDTFPSSNFDY